MKVFPKTLIASLLTLSAQGFAAEAPEKEVDICSQEMLISYFPAPFVESTLKQFDVPKDKWAAIVSGLSEQEKKVVELVEAQAAKQTPNPLKDPKYREEAIKIFRAVLLNLFTEVLSKEGISDQQKLKSMLDAIQEQKRVQFTKCLERFTQDSN